MTDTTQHYSENILMSLSPNAIGSILNSLIASNDELTFKNHELLVYVSELLNDLEEFRIKNKQLEEAMDTAHDRMEHLSDELALTNDHLMSMSSDNAQDQYWAQADMSILEDELSWLTRELEIERDLNDDLREDNEMLESKLLDLELMLTSGYYDYDYMPENAFIPESAFEDVETEEEATVA